MKKVLFTATVSDHIKTFHMPYIKWFKEKGYEVHVACSGHDEISFIDKKIDMCFNRSPYKTSNITAYFKMKKLIRNNRYDIIHCHTPMGAAITRLAARKARKSGTVVLYTAHGFHFYKGAPTINWLIYYPIEKVLARYTDCLITINEEDYNNVINRKFKAKDIRLINGVGIDLSKFKLRNLVGKSQARKKYGYKDTDFILFYAAELNENKNQGMLIYVIDSLKEKIPNIKLLLAGKGQMEEKYRELIMRLKLEKYIKLLGYRRDITDLLAMSDIAVASSKREGLPVNIMEAMATGLPVVASNVRGHSDLIKEKVNGYLISLDDIDGFSKAVLKLNKKNDLRNIMGTRGAELIQKYSLDSVLVEITSIYSEYIGKD